MIFESTNNGLMARHQNEMIYIEAWGKDSLRVRTTKYMSFTDRTWALSEEISPDTSGITISMNQNHSATIQNGTLYSFIERVGLICKEKNKVDNILW